MSLSAVVTPDVSSRPSGAGGTSYTDDSDCAAHGSLQEPPSRSDEMFCANDSQSSPVVVLDFSRRRGSSPSAGHSQRHVPSDGHPLRRASASLGTAAVPSGALLPSPSLYLRGLVVNEPYIFSRTQAMKAASVNKMDLLSTTASDQTVEQIRRLSDPGCGRRWYVDAQTTLSACTVISTPPSHSVDQQSDAASPLPVILTTGISCRSPALTVTPPSPNSGGSSTVSDVCAIKLQARRHSLGPGILNSKYLDAIKEETSLHRAGGCPDGLTAANIKSSNLSEAESSPTASNRRHSLSGKLCSS